MSSPKMLPHCLNVLVAGDDHRRRVVADGHQAEHQVAAWIERDVADPSITSSG